MSVQLPKKNEHGRPLKHIEETKGDKPTSFELCARVVCINSQLVSSPAVQKNWSRKIMKLGKHIEGFMIAKKPKNL